MKEKVTAQLAKRYPYSLASSQQMWNSSAPWQDKAQQRSELHLDLHQFGLLTNISTKLLTEVGR